MPKCTRLKLSKLYGLDTYKGEVIWSNDQILQNCDQNDFNVLYAGILRLVIITKSSILFSLIISTFCKDSYSCYFTDLKNVSNHLSLASHFLVYVHSSIDFYLLNIPQRSHLRSICCTQVMSHEVSQLDDTWFISGVTIYLKRFVRGHKWTITSVPSRFTTVRFCNKTNCN